MLKKHKVNRKLRGRPKRGTGLVDLKDIGQRIRQLRGEENQTDFAKMLEVTQGQLSRYEAGTASPSLDVLVRLRKSKGRTVDWILIGDKD